MKPSLMPSLTFVALAGTLWLASASATASLAPRASLASSANSAAAVEYKFREAPLNSLGIKSMSDLRGKPVLIDFWGRN